MKYICWETFLQNFLWNGRWHHEVAKVFVRTLDNIWKVAENMDARDETQKIHSCYAAGWEKY